MECKLLLIGVSFVCGSEYMYVCTGVAATLARVSEFVHLHGNLVSSDELSSRMSSHS